ncbi:hypothetical protein ACQBAR_01155 [Propionibacteriaceae bacterium Y1685]|uniref:hypothetical protein n=1 Tax=Microlunatus sp. Y1700 TaxID=3418487 RepID=UPI003B79DC8E
MSYQQPGTAGPQDPNPYGAAPGAGPQGADPGAGMGKVGMILAIIPCTWFIGLILSIIANVQSKNAGFENKNAKIGIIVGIVWGVIAIVGNIINFAVNS